MRTRIRGPSFVRHNLCVSTDDHRYVLVLGCPDSTGIVARIAGFLADVGAWIVEAAYHSDPDTGWFFTRQAVRADALSLSVQELRERFDREVVRHLGPGTSWHVTDTSVRKRAVLLVSKEGHCLGDLLGRAYRGELPADVPEIIGNHRDQEDFATRMGVPFRHISFESDPEQAFGQLADEVDALDPDVIVLAKFMRVLPPWLCERWAGRAINIHHSFLPSFVGARPYHRAYERGVKLIGATCHYVTADLDAGPIIEQDVIRVDHADSVADLVRQGRDIEKLVLARGLRWHLEDRVLVHGNKTVVFD